MNFLVINYMSYYEFISAIDLTYGTILCFSCGDYVYDTEIEHIASTLQQKMVARCMGENVFEVQTKDVLYSMRQSIIVHSL